MGIQRYRITHSLLSAWQWSFRKEDGYDDFLKTLKREKTQQTGAMLDGIHFENMVNARFDESEVPEGHSWKSGVDSVFEIVQGGAKQVKASRNIDIYGEYFQLFGIIDYLKNGTIYDCKFSKKYYTGKYSTSTQHPMYFAICPEAENFVYLSSDGENVYKEWYERENTVNIEEIIQDFINYLDNMWLMDIYKENWKSKF